MNIPPADKRFTVSLVPELLAKVDDLARRRDASRSRFIDWCIRQVIDLTFLTPANREFIRSMQRELGHPWSDLTVIDCLIASAQRGVRDGSLVPVFFQGVAPRPAVTTESAESVPPEAKQKRKTA